MAWTEQAWRYSLAAIPDPEQGLDEQQTHFAIGGTTYPQVGFGGDLSATLGGFTASFAGEFSAPTPLTWTNLDRLAVHLIPEPDAGFSDSTRHTMGAVPGVGLDASTDSDGDIVAVMSGFTASFTGTVVDPIVDGALEASLSAFTASFTGEAYYLHFFDAEYSVTPTWVVIEQPARFGDLVPVLGGFTTDLVGTALPPDSTQGRINSVVSGFSADFTGTMTAPPNRDGEIGIDIEVFTSSFRGTAVPPQGVVGAVSSTLSEFSASFAGTFEGWETDGDLSTSLAGFTPSLRGVFVSAEATFGLMPISMGSFTSSLRGTVFGGHSYLLGTVTVTTATNGTVSLSPRVIGTITLNEAD